MCHTRAMEAFLNLGSSYLMVFHTFRLWLMDAQRYFR